MSHSHVRLCRDTHRVSQKFRLSSRICRLDPRLTCLQALSLVWYRFLPYVCGRLWASCRHVLIQVCSLQASISLLRLSLTVDHLPRHPLLRLTIRHPLQPIHHSVVAKAWFLVSVWLLSSKKRAKFAQIVHQNQNRLPSFDHVVHGHYFSLTSSYCSHYSPSRSSVWSDSRNLAHLTVQCAL
jgi:hypothetical protein